MQQNQTVNSVLLIFQLRKQHPDCYYTGVTINFSNSQPISQPTQTQSSVMPLAVLPTFNVDHCFFTPAFTLSVDRNYYHSNKDFEKQKFQDKRFATEQQQCIEEMFQPQPVIIFCQICKMVYHDYLNHINEKSHVRQVDRSYGNKSILEACNKWKRNCKDSIPHDQNSKIIKKQERQFPKQKIRKNAKVKKKNKLPSQTKIQEPQSKLNNLSTLINSL